MQKFQDTALKVAQSIYAAQIIDISSLSFGSFRLNTIDWIEEYLYEY